MTALDLVRIMRANLKLLALAALIGTLLAAGYTLTRPTLYTASSTVQVIAGNSVDANAAVLSQQLSSGRAGYYAQLASSSGVANRIVEASKGSLKPGEFAVAGASSEGSATLTLLATASSPAKAQRAADLARTALADEAKYMETVGTDAKTSVYRVFPLTAAARPSAPSSPNWQRNLVAGAAVGLLAGIVLVVLRKQLDSRIRHTSEVEKLTGSGVLGVIPKAPTLQSKRRGGLGELGTTAEAFRMLRTNLRYISTERPPRSLVITSAMQGEGKSTVASNLARALALAGERVLVVDADLRRPRQHDLFQVAGDVGLSEVLAGEVQPDDALAATGLPNLTLLPRRPDAPEPVGAAGLEAHAGPLEAGVGGLLRHRRLPSPAARHGRLAPGHGRGRDGARGASGADPQGPPGGRCRESRRGGRASAGRRHERRRALPARRRLLLWLRVREHVPQVPREVPLERRFVREEGAAFTPQGPHA